MARHQLALTLALLTCVSGCEKPEVNTSPVNIDSLDTNGLSHQLGRQIEQVEQLARDLMVQLDQGVQQFVESPTADELALIRKLWKDAHIAWLDYSFFSIARTEDHDIDGWPIAPGFVDSLPQYPDSGIVNDVTLELSPETLREQHGFTDREEAVLGLHPIGFLISKQLEKFEPSATHYGRRKRVLSMASSLLVTDAREIIETRIEVRAQVLAAAEDSPEEFLVAILTRLHQSVTPLFYTSSRYSDESGSLDPDGHASRVVLERQLRRLQELSGPRTPLGGILQQLSAEDASNYHKTLAEVRDRLEQAELPEEEMSLIPLAMASLGHQLEDFIALLRPTVSSQDF